MGGRKIKKLESGFFDRDASVVAKELLGKIIYHKSLRARIIETESYYKYDKASHASLGYTEKRKALFMPSGTIYMYYARGGASFNISCSGDGNAVLIKSAFAADVNNKQALFEMQKNNPPRFSSISAKGRPVEKLCSGQTLLCKSLKITVEEWNTKNFDETFFIYSGGYIPQEILNTRRLGIPKGRDEHLLLRFIDAKYLKYTTPSFKD